MDTRCTPERISLCYIYDQFSYFRINRRSSKYSFPGFVCPIQLESLGYKVTTRTSSAEALELFKAKPEKFDLVVTDMTMPNMTGDELAEELIALRSDIPVILCTGFSTRINKEKAQRMGIRALVMKPIVRREIAKTIRLVLDEK